MILPAENVLGEHNNDDRFERRHFCWSAESRMLFDDSLHYGTEQPDCRTSKSRFPTSLGVSEWAQRSARAKRAVRSKRTSERCAWTSERTSKWLSTYVPILGFSNPLCVDLPNGHLGHQPKWARLSLIWGCSTTHFGAHAETSEMGYVGPYLGAKNVSYPSHDINTVSLVVQGVNEAAERMYLFQN